MDQVLPRAFWRMIPPEDTSLTGIEKARADTTPPAQAPPPGGETLEAVIRVYHAPGGMGERRLKIFPTHTDQRLTGRASCEGRGGGRQHEQG